MEMRYMMFASVLALSFGAGGGAALAQADEALVADGEKVFRRCAACHQVGEGAENKVGPELADVIGRTAGSVPDFDYSDAMVAAGEGGMVWTEETLDPYLANPKAVVKGTSMAFAGLRKEEDRQAVIAYIASQQVPPATN
jgi:cytochrome c